MGWLSKLKGVGKFLYRRLKPIAKATAKNQLDEAVKADGFLEAASDAAIDNVVDGVFDEIDKKIDKK